MYYTFSDPEGLSSERRCMYKYGISCLHSNGKNNLSEYEPSSSKHVEDILKN
jgi:hypothetical protein